jgi:hypothetical protein
VYKGPEHLPLDLLLFDELLYSIEFKSHETWNWESTPIEPHNDRHHRLDVTCLDAFSKSMNPLEAFNKINRVVMLSRPVIRKKRSQGNTYRQALLPAALIIGNAVTATVSVYSFHQDEGIPMFIDTGASDSVTSVLTDFVGPLPQCATATLKGWISTTEVIEEGTASWLVRDMFVNKRKIRTTA